MSLLRCLFICRKLKKLACFKWTFVVTTKNITDYRNTTFCLFIQRSVCIIALAVSERSSRVASVFKMILCLLARPIEAIQYTCSEVHSVLLWCCEILVKIARDCLHRWWLLEKKTTDLCKSKLWFSVSFMALWLCCASTVCCTHW